MPHWIDLFIIIFRSFGCKSTGWDVCQRPTTARLNSPTDNRVGALRGPSLWHLPHPPGLQRVCLEDPLPILRDWIDQTEDNWGKQAAGRHGNGGHKNRLLQERLSLHLRVGDTRQASTGGRLFSGEHSQCKRLTYNSCVQGILPVHLLTCLQWGIYSMRWTTPRNGQLCWHAMPVSVRALELHSGSRNCKHCVSTDSAHHRAAHQVRCFIVAHVNLITTNALHQDNLQTADDTIH